MDGAREAPPDGVEVDAGLVRLRVKNVGQLFNSLDPAPFRERDLDDDAVAWIVSWAGEVHERTPLKLRVEIAEPRAGIDHRAVITTGVQNHFAYLAWLAGRELRQLLRIGRVSLVIGLAVLAGAFTLGSLVVSLLGESPVTALVREGLSIGGWVAMWKPTEIFLYSWWPIRARRKLYERLSAMPIEVALLAPPA